MRGVIYICNITIYNSLNHKKKIQMQAVRRTQMIYTFSKKIMQMAVFEDFNYDYIKKMLISKSTLIGSNPNYFELKNYNRITLEHNSKPIKVKNMHITLYDKNKSIDEPPILAISYYVNGGFENSLKKLKRKIKNFLK